MVLQSKHNNNQEMHSRKCLQFSIGGVQQLDDGDQAF